MALDTAVVWLVGSRSLQQYQAPRTVHGQPLPGLDDSGRIQDIHHAG